MSLSAVQMKSQGEETAEFENPVGIYNQHGRNSTLKYQAKNGEYRKVKDSLVLQGDVKVKSEETDFEADRMKYSFKKDLILASGHVKFTGLDLKTGDKLKINSQKMKARPKLKQSDFTGEVTGVLQRKRRYEGDMNFTSQLLRFDGMSSLAHLEGNVFMKRDNYRITAGKADIYLENFNKSLKYFVLNDDVKMTETLNNPQTGVMERKAFAERLEGFGREEKMILSGAPRVEQGSDVIKGYRITVRENTDLIEVDDAMSDMQMKKKEKKKE
jgi:lipopolysaccharide export system protein LptA